jgi:hypothetical protein
MGPTRKTSAIDVLYAMVRDKESLLPAHKDSPAVILGHGQVRSLQLVFNMSECWEALPVDHVFLFRGTPVARQEAVTAPNDFGIEIRCELWPVLCQTAYPQVATQKR